VPVLLSSGFSEQEALRQAKQDVTARLNGAYQVLSDDGRRAEYVRSLEAGPASAQVDVAALLAAEESFAWAVVRVKARRFAEALPALEKAIELNPLEGEFYAWRGWARFAAAADPRAVEAAASADVHRALELSPKCAAAWLFSARIAAALGHGGKATEAYRKCLAIDAGHIEAQRELRLLEGRGTTK
jgi:tetratricopeptide (TPR) repeat protein